MARWGGEREGRPPRTPVGCVLMVLAALPHVCSSQLMHTGVPGVGSAGRVISSGRMDQVLDRDISPQHDRCEPIAITMCKSDRIPYNTTMMPNMLDHQTQEEAGLEVHQFFPLVKVDCSPDLHMFLCSVYVPLCTIMETPLPPCRPLCLSAKQGCENLMNKFGFQWPESLDCNKFPADSELCFIQNRSSVGRPRPPKLDVLNDRGRRPPNQYAGKDFQCPVHFKVPKNFKYRLRIGSVEAPDCGAPCHGMFFTDAQLTFSRQWVGAWAAVCIVSCTFTIASFLVDVRRFRYPERPIIWISGCYWFIGVVFVVGLIQGDKVACDAPWDPPKDLPEIRGHMVSTITQGVEREFCTILFMTLYFFFMASSIWWVVLCLTWFLAAGLKWGHEAIEANSAWFHVAAWAVPAVKTIVILATGNVEGDVLTGTCFVGLWNVSALRWYVLAPLFIYLVLGTVFLITGFVSLFRIRTIMKHDGTKTDKLERFMVRIGVFSVLYTVPATVVLACLFYEQALHEQWTVTWQRDRCNSRVEPWLSYNINCPPVGSGVGMLGDGYGSRPDFIVFMAKYLSMLVVGITSGFWVWSGKTLALWKNCYFRCFGHRPESYV
ncbi:frizzled class receptor [Oratosquilla oratoria]|uniref:frizzled class receptor n=1 Tax=Oratosquilla oratoria TaxID=337810 RepID=UPI003F760B80